MSFIHEVWLSIVNNYQLPQRVSPCPV